MARRGIMSLYLAAREHAQQPLRTDENNNDQYAIADHIFQRARNVSAGKRLENTEGNSAENRSRQTVEAAEDRGRKTLDADQPHVRRQREKRGDQNAGNRSEYRCQNPDTQ